MGPKRGKKGTPWPEPRFADDPDIRAYVAAAIKDLEALKKHQEALEIGMPRELSTTVVDTFLHLARRVKNTPTNEQLAQPLAKVELHVEKTQKEVSQASREITTTKSNTNRLVEAICHPTFPGVYGYEAGYAPTDLLNKMVGDPIAEKIDRFNKNQVADEELEDLASVLISSLEDYITEDADEYDDKL
ncbi:hypothetical protein TSTA_126810 [Talaromyces stipitatus ATCC 10500]|uniref:Uncharacterized protein n=1 Tax=Talaromyces stipitatus (strain ATCC 10500 / CBS 375.48 / QM 6759 / NRRL 1006) TaxID=441959 RepID=B8MCS1_TALSN|nr:uncharacterized protein TSTA_126810 [Talaromyces stipitatus ATCC 10500]EED18973.1 hypothetical protein TSTA_126810 [Talaromyces stipitatus ATCC 10500]